MRRHALSAVVALSLAAAGCHRDAEPGSCYRARDGACVEYGPSEAAAAKRMCAGFTWTPGAASCPKEGRVGTCAREGGTVVEILYSGPPNQFTAESAKRACESSGGAFAR